MRKKNSYDNMVFDHEAIRRFIGLIALLLPVAVVLSAWKILDSISISYHTPTGFPFLPYFPTPRDIFVGALFVIGAFLMSYRGRQYDQARKFWVWLQRFWSGAVNFGVEMRKREEDIVSTVGGIAAWLVALFPTEEIKADGINAKPLITFGVDQGDVLTQVSHIHLVCAAILFLTTVYFCFCAFIKRLKMKIDTRGPAGPWYSDPLNRRKILYYISGGGILLTLLFLLIMGILDSLQHGIIVIYNQTYWAEYVMLFLFGLAWLVASKPPGLIDPSEQEESKEESKNVLSE